MVKGLASLSALIVAAVTFRSGIITALTAAEIIAVDIRTGIVRPPSVWILSAAWHGRDLFVITLKTGHNLMKKHEIRVK